MPTAPYVVAAATETLESVSNTPTPTSIGSIARGGLSAVEVISAAARTTGTDAERAAVTAHAALSSEPASMPTKNNPKPSAATTARPAPAAIARCPSARGSRDSDGDAREHECHPEPLQRSRHVSAGRVDGEGHDRRRCRDGSDDSHRPDREAAVESTEADHRSDSGACGGQEVYDTRKGVPGKDYPEEDADQADGL